MKKYTLSNSAQKDLEKIYQYTAVEFGELQAESYLIGINDCLQLLCDEPELAHDISDIRLGYFRYLYRKHSIFFKQRENDILVVRILHQQMKLELHITS
ncbi:type II toxin-antitoxin system RelE/ParE family toxin [Thalassotalea sp. LPB0316]|uniref:type II toxin-antitoxin system RelE/ParE family toxin n=1 Tax=Thalassotalea sp. LPB0316 TaxID=2769490 RepID=UPI001868AD82|nr:type II toxin-antitoxin system RelE/ParE family toxin [Thalassotalea sp. LPB0316]QOL25572.1 type II toxin-antitoxin system RelE/ParE family toxin [Thalassotalea sp. LPB0316]